MLFTRRSETPREVAELRARIVQLLAENDRLKGEQRLEAAARAELVEAVRTLSLEVAAGRIDLRQVRRAYDWSTALGDLQTE